MSAWTFKIATSSQQKDRTKLVPLRLQMGKSQVNVTQSIDKVLTMSSDRFIRRLNDTRRPKASLPDFNQANFAD